MSEAFARLRSMLTEPGTSERWWQAVELALGGGEESELLQEHLVAHASRDEGWRGCRVPCGDWEPEHPGYGLCDLQTRAIEGLPAAVEVYCPPGTFRMGAPPGDEEAWDEEKPARDVTLTRGFWVLSTPVTQAMYEAVTGKNPSFNKGSKGSWFGSLMGKAKEPQSRPVELVNWFDAVLFCNRLSEKAGLSPAYRFHGEKKVEWLRDADGFRLPTEAEWEYLCRAGSTSARYGELDKVAWYDGNSDEQTHPVGQKEPNAWGVFDTLGNVWEWCVDEWDEEAYSKLPQVDPAHVPHLVDMRVLRGGGYFYLASSARASFRFRFYADDAYGNVGSGFRIVRTPRVEAKKSTSEGSSPQPPVPGQRRTSRGSSSSRTSTESPETLSQTRSTNRHQSGLQGGSQRSIPLLPDAVEVYCPPGTFRMGASPGDDKALSDEMPAREMTLTRGFWALSTPVTQAMYEAVTGKNPSSNKGSWFGSLMGKAKESKSRPVENVNWFDAVRFCNQLSELAGLASAYEFHGQEEVKWLQYSDGYRLPTEAEWEYLCRAGSTSARYGDLDKVAWFKGNSGGKTHPVGQKEPNAWGLFDTLGNVYEWCMDEFDGDAYIKLPQVDPAHVPHLVDERVLRGGCWIGDAEGARASCRDGFDAGYAYGIFGFRFVRTPRVEAQP